MTGGKHARAVFTWMLALVLMQLTGTMRRDARAEGQGVQMVQARSALEQSVFTGEEKKLVLSSADRAAAAGVPAEDMAIVITRGLNQGTGAKQLAFFLEAAAGLREQGLPIRLVLDRIEQGLAKGVPGERISSSVQNLAGSVRNAEPIVRGLQEKAVAAGDSGKTIEIVARALEKSITAEDIGRTAEKIRNQDAPLSLFNRAVDTMTNFAGNGMDSAEASRLVQRAMDRGCSERDLEIMERYMVDELRMKSPMSSIVSGMEARMERGSMRGNSDRAAGMRGPGQGGMGSGTMGGRR